MKPISNFSKEAQTHREKRFYTEEDLEEQIGVSKGATYMLHEDSPEGVALMKVTEISHSQDSVEINDDVGWYRGHGTPKDEFFKQIFAVAEIYKAATLNQGVEGIENQTPQKTMKVWKESWKAFPRQLI